MCSYVKVQQDADAKTVTSPHDISNPSPAGFDSCLADRWPLTGLIDFCGKGEQPHPAKSLLPAHTQTRADLDICVCSEGGRLSLDQEATRLELLTAFSHW